MFSKITKSIDYFINKQGEITSMLIIPLLIVVVYEVVMRYGFNSPTTWGFEATAFLYGLHYMFGVSYTDVHDGHVRVDIFTSLCSRKVKAFLSALTTLILFLPVTTGLTIWSFKFAMTSLQMKEQNPTSWAPPIYPFKILMALCFLFLLLSGVSHLLKELQFLFSVKDTRSS